MSNNNKNEPPKYPVDRLPLIRSPQVQKPPPIKRNIGSVESSRRQEANRQLVEYYRANPIKGPANVNVLDNCNNNKENGAYAKKPPLPMKYERLIIPHYAPAYVKPAGHGIGNNVIKQVGRAVLERPHYNVMPQWWG